MMRPISLSVRPEILVLLVVVGVVLSLSLLSSCSRVGLLQGVSEGMAIMGSAVEYKMGDGVQGSWDTKAQASGSALSWRKQPHETYGSKLVTPDQGMSFFADTEFKPECCGSTYSANGGLLATKGYTSGGCACMSPQQIDYINTRGGNRTQGGDF